MARMYVPRWSVYVVVAALIASLSFSLGSLYSASGTNHGITCYACLYAGSLSQVGEAPPANYGRGSQISWNSEGHDGSSGISQAFSAQGPHSFYLGHGDPDEDGLTLLQSLNVPAGICVVSASVALGNADGNAQLGVCRIDSVGFGAVWSESLELSESTIVPLQAVVAMDQSETIELRCASFSQNPPPGDSDLFAIQSVLAAIQVDQNN